MSQITSRSLSELRALVDGGDISAAEVVRAHREVVISENGSLNAFTEVTTEGAGHDGPLHGIPVAIKDAFVDGDRIPSMGSRIHPAWLSGTAGIIRRVREAGGTVLGYTNLHEWAIGTTSAVTATGPIRNPWDPSVIAGGSSGGSAVAVASGMAPVAIGTDAAGSTRIPAACCGIVGFKPTFGALPLDGEPAAASPLNSAGVMARNVEDVSLLFSLLGARAIAPVATDALTLGIPRGFFFDEVEPAVASVVEGAAEMLGGAFAATRTVSLEGVEGAAAVVSRVFLPQVAAGLRDPLAADPDLFEAQTRKALLLGLELESAPEADASPVVAAWERAFEDCDVIAVPTLAGVPPSNERPIVTLPSGTRPADLAQIALNAPMNVAGLPALALPCGEVDGLATGITLVGPKGSDDVVLAAGAELERLLDGAFRDRVAPSGGTDDRRGAR